MALYRARVAAGTLEADSAQRLAVEKLQLLWMRLVGYNPTKPKRVGLGLFGWGREKLEEKSVPGLYLYGGVGRGKSMLMDIFFETAPVNPKRRVHFHAFMQEIHAGVHAERQKGERDPLRIVADRVADGATLLCFDEMQITDITDAMLVGRLFERLFERGVVIVTTSNRAPDELYKDGLNRQLFLPFIALIKEKLEVHELVSATDHRRDRVLGAQVYFSPLGAEATAGMDALWSRLTTGPGTPLVLEVQGREVRLPAHEGRVARASFADLCARPLGAADYLAIADAVDWLLLEDVPMLSPARNNEAKRFVTLIDALYEARTRLGISAAAEPERLYVEGAGAFEFERTASRLQEMRSEDWLR
ncbi:MAG: cell division protein ZapE [Rhodovulum sulfidophilum]|uniref:Cell division protein ZapE n=1 Tax=Rhodovulum sulfidophilum TaxID=35806 RepID=A0A2W5NJI7_RHOSU|nr:MAG: cell division protein ZapE [Rhodovulum sulfidophilum]